MQTIFDLHADFPRVPMIARVPMFHAVPLRGRHDGWTPLRQAEFIGFLAQLRSVGQAAAEVGMSRETAYRLRRRKWSESFVRAWDVAAGKTTAKGHVLPSRKVTYEELKWRVDSGRWQVVICAGEYCRAVRKPDVSALLKLNRMSKFL